MEEVSKGRMVAYFGILFIICILSFLTAKYILRSSIKKGDIPVDTSVKLK